MIESGSCLSLVALLYFYIWFDIDYGISADEVAGIILLTAGSMLIFIGWLRQEEEKHWNKRERDWKDGNP